MNPDDPLVSLDRVTKRYTRPDGSPDRPVLDGVSLAVAQGASLAVVGPSGSGKSTLLNLLGSLDRPTAGTVRVAGRDLAGLDRAERAAFRRATVGFVFQRHHLLPHLNAIENVLLPTLAGGAPDADAPARARRLLERVGLGDRLDYRPGSLSGGESQRVAVVRALVNRPRLLLADEPTGSLDHAAAAELVRLLGELRREQGVTLLVATHADALAGSMERVLRLEDGRLLESGCRGA